MIAYRTASELARQSRAFWMTSKASSAPSFLASHHRSISPSSTRSSVAAMVPSSPVGGCASKNGKPGSPTFSGSKSSNSVLSSNAAARTLKCRRVKFTSESGAYSHPRAEEATQAAARHNRQRMHDIAEVAARMRTENFPIASLLFPRALRPHLRAVYGYCRLVEILGDEVEGDRLAALDELERELEACY